MHAAPTYISSEEDDIGDITMVASSSQSMNPTDPIASMTSDEFTDDNGIDDLIANYISEPEDSHDALVSRVSDASPRTSPGSVLSKRTCQGSTSSSSKKVKVLEDDDDDDDPFRDSKHTKVLPPQSEVSPHYIISHVESIQTFFDRHSISYGAQYELARLLNNKVIKVVPMELLNKLRGQPDKIAAPLVTQELLRNKKHEDDSSEFSTFVANAFKAERDATLPWEEQGLEEERLKADPDAGLGFSDVNSEWVPWYGGKVHYKAKLKNTGTAADPRWGVELDKAELGPSNRFARQFGSNHFLRVKASDKVVGKHSGKVKEFFHKAFILNGRVFRAFYEKDKTVFLFMTNEIFRNGVITVGSHGMGLLDFMQWHNPLELNPDQAMAKWASRFALGLSTSVPGFVLEACNIYRIPDVVSQEGSDMTDGAGLANLATLREIQRQFTLDGLPTAVQVRIDGAKGLICRRAQDVLEKVPEVYLRPSMIKIKREPVHKAHRIIDVLRTSHPRVSSRLSPEVIINLANNGVPLSAFQTLLEQNFEALTAPFVAWEGEDAMLELWRAVCWQGRVMQERAGRRGVSTARLRGLAEKEDEELDEDDEDGLKSDEGSTAWWGDEVSGQPSGLEDTVLYLLVAGFKPQDCPVLREKLFKALESAVSYHARRCRIDIPMSVMTLIIPDRDGILEPNEVFFQSSRRNLPGADGLETDIITGDVLLTRYPCKLPTDVQKWRAVNSPAFRDLTDVIIMSTKGVRRAADNFSGGDYDGDKVLMIWQPELVHPFINSGSSFSIPPKDLEETNFEKRKETVGDFRQRASKDGTQYIEELQNVLLNGLSDTSVVGAYSNMHDFASYVLGYGHPETIRLAYMFCNVLDGSKSGLRVRFEVMKEDNRKYNTRCKWVDIQKDQKDRFSAQLYAKRPNGFGPFIMDSLQNHAGIMRDRHLEKLKETFTKPFNYFDRALAQPWHDACRRAAMIKEGFSCNLMQEDLAKIKAHVEEVYSQQTKHTLRSPSKNGGNGFTELKIETRQDILREQSKRFARRPVPYIYRATVSPESELSPSFSADEIDRIKASYAYIYDAEKCADGWNKWTRFPWDVATRSLCEIKAKSIGRPTTLTGEFYERMKVIALKK